MAATSEGLKFNMANIPSSCLFDDKNNMLVDEIRGNIPPVLDYSSRNWSFHLTSTPTNLGLPLIEPLSEFLQNRGLFWIETMNLLKASRHCDEMSRVASRWVAEVEVSCTA